MTVHKIAIYNEKGRVGKTPIALELALQRGLNYATNQNRPRHDIAEIIPEDEFLQVAPNEEFPELDNDMLVVFDLAGELVGYESSILSALRQADIILMPVVNEPDAIEGTAYAIREIESVESITAPIVVIANLLKSDNDFLEIRDRLFGRLGVGKYTIFPLQFSKAFDRIFESKKSIAELMKGNPLRAHSFRKVHQQFKAITNHIDAQ